jgi:hypothetical protein
MAASHEGLSSVEGASGSDGTTQQDASNSRFAVSPGGSPLLHAARRDAARHGTARRGHIAAMKQYVLRAHDGQKLLSNYLCHSISERQATINLC